MPTCRRAPARLPPAMGAALIALALALGGMAHPVRADEALSKPQTDATVRIKAFPPSVQIDTGAADQKADADGATREGMHADRHIQVDSDEDFDVDQFRNQVQKMPWVIGLIFLVVGSIFLTPVVLLIGIIWYKLRKTRLQNEAMLALAAKGVVPPAQAADALATGASPAAVAPQVYQQALALRRRVVWSDLRKGVIMVMVGLAFLLYGITANGEASWVGMILTFVGIGYLVLWWLEGRHLAHSASAPPGNGAGTSSSGG
jgi:Domain of unknown function (DUF6249)